MLNAFVCEFCNCLAFSAEWMRAHEQTCAYNPKNSNNTISVRPSGSTIIIYPYCNMVPCYMPYPTPQWCYYYCLQEIKK